VSDSHISVRFGKEYLNQTCKRFRLIGVLCSVDRASRYKLCK